MRDPIHPSAPNNFFLRLMSYLSILGFPPSICDKISPNAKMIQILLAFRLISLAPAFNIVSTYGSG
jgi:hypothetical protein